MSDEDASWLTVAGDLPAALRFTRVIRGQSLREVAKATGVSHSTLNRVEHGEVLELTLTRYVAIAMWLAGKDAVESGGRS